jgi:hypothetical protein
LEIKDEGGANFLVERLLKDTFAILMVEMNRMMENILSKISLNYYHHI